MSFSIWGIERPCGDMELLGDATGSRNEGNPEGRNGVHSCRDVSRDR